MLVLTQYTFHIMLTAYSQSEYNTAWIMEQLC